MEWQEAVDPISIFSSVDEYKSVQSKLEELKDGAEVAFRAHRKVSACASSVVFESNDPKKDYAGLQRIPWQR